VRDALRGPRVEDERGVFNTVGVKFD
jgi:hypothetical protein